MDLQLHELSKVSNNSVLTNLVLNALNEKLDDKEKRDFREWLRLVNNTQQNNNSSSFRRY